MMPTTTYDQDSLLFELINAEASALKLAITGRVYPDERLDSGLEDVVVNTINVTSDQIQLGAGNVNLYVPDVLLSDGRYVADKARLSQLTQLAWAMLDEVHFEDHSFWVTDQQDVAEPETHTHYSNLRIEFRHYTNL